MATGPKLTVKFNNKQPVDVIDLTTSLNAMVRQYQKFAVQFDDVATRSEAHLYIQDLKKGSIIADLVPYAQEIGAVFQGVAPYTDDAKKVLGFAKYIKVGMDALLAGKKPSDEVTAKDLKDLSHILEPVAKENGATFVFQATDGATQNITVNYNSQETNTIQNQSAKQIELMKEPEQRRFNNRLMYWYSATRGKPSKTTDKAIIETVSKRPMPVTYSDPEIKEKILAGRENPFLIGFMVDVELLIVRGDVRGYHILNLRDTLEDDDAAEEE